MNPYVSDVTKFKKQVKKLGYSGNPLRENSMTKRYRNALKAAVKKGVLFPTYGSVYMRNTKRFRAPQHVLSKRESGCLKPSVKKQQAAASMKNILNSPQFRQTSRCLKAKNLMINWRKNTRPNFGAETMGKVRIGTGALGFDNKEIRQTQSRMVSSMDVDVPYIPAQDPNLMTYFKWWVLPILKKLYHDYIQIDVIYRWTSSDGMESHDSKRCINAFQMSRAEISKLMRELNNLDYGLDKPGSASEAIIKRFVIKKISGAAGGCWNIKGHGRKERVCGHKFHNPYSTNNNCGFALLKKIADTEGYALPYKLTVKPCNELRAKYDLKPNSPVPASVLYNIFVNEFNRMDKNLRLAITTSFIEPIHNYQDDIKTITKYKFLPVYGDTNPDYQLFLKDNHYWLFEGQKIQCTRCLKWSYGGIHTCNDDRARFVISKSGGICNGRFKDQPLKNNKVLHYDIETHHNNPFNNHEPYIVGYVYSKLDGEVVYGTFEGEKCMKAFYDFLGTSDVEHVKYINAYNGATFDHYYLVNEIIDDENLGISENDIFHNKRCLKVSVQGKITIDLNQHLVGSLKQNLEDNDCSVAKGDIDHDLSMAWENTTQERKTEVKEYLKADVMGLKELYEKYNQPTYDEFKQNVCDMLTVSSMAYTLWRNKFLPEKTERDEVIYPPKLKDEVYMRQAMYGGRTYPNKRYFKSAQYQDIWAQKELDHVDASGVEHYRIPANKLEETWKNLTDFLFDADVVSLYPFCMANFDYPVGHSFVTNNYVEGKIGIYKIRYKTNKSLLNPVLPRKDESGALKWDLIDWEGWYSSVDIELAKENGYEIEVLTGYYWKNSRKVFKSYIDHFYKNKQNAKKGTAMYTTAKLMLNSLYGKMLQKQINVKRKVITTPEEFAAIFNKHVVLEFRKIKGNKTMVVYEEQQELKEHRVDKPTHLGVLILSYSRKVMYDYYKKCGNNMENLHYSHDTDSLVIHGRLLSNGSFKCGKNLGDIADDIGGSMAGEDGIGAKIIRAIFVQPKLYALHYLTRDGQIKFAFRGKGVSMYTNKNQHYLKSMEMRKEKGNPELHCWKDFTKMIRGEGVDYYKTMRMDKKFFGSVDEENASSFGHKHVKPEDTKRTLGKNAWRGRHFLNYSESVPWGHESISSA